MSNNRNSTACRRAVIQQNLRAVGIDLDVRTYEFATLYADVLKGNFQMYTCSGRRHRWPIPTCCGVCSIRSRRRPGLQPRPLQRSRASTPARRSGLVDRRGAAVWSCSTEVQRLIAEQAPYISLWYKTNFIVAQRDARRLHRAPARRFRVSEGRARAPMSWPTSIARGCMNLPFEYERLAIGEFGGLHDHRFRHARVVILPVPLDRTTSYVPGTRNGPHEILVASSHMELWDEETADRRPRHRDLHAAGDGIAVCDDGRSDQEIRRVATEIVSRGKFPVVLGGEHSITAPVVAALAERHPGLSVLQIDAHADLRDSFMGTPHSHACAMRRVLEHARGRRSASAVCRRKKRPRCPRCRRRSSTTTTCGRTISWIERVVASLGETVYITIDCDGFDPAIMPAVGTPEPGGLSWYERLALLRRVIESRRVVGCDIVELCPLPGNVAPNFLCAKLLYKILAYRFGRRAFVFFKASSSFSRPC